MIQLSLGQERVREIIAEYYPEYIEQRNRTGKRESLQNSISIDETDF